MNARAYTTGHNIVFGAGGFAPGTHERRRLIAHELTHVMQQSGPDGILLDQSDKNHGLSPNYSMKVPGAAALYVQRTPGGGGSSTPSTPLPSWLSGVKATHVQGNIYKIDLTGEGQTYVGPYQELANYVAKNNLGLESHHIVGDEFIGMVATGYTYETMPAVALRPKGHEPITTSVNAQLGHYGGRRGGRVQLKAREIAGIYKETYTGWTPFKELYGITENILRLPHEATVKPTGGVVGKTPKLPSEEPTTTAEPAPPGEAKTAEPVISEQWGAPLEPVTQAIEVATAVSETPANISAKGGVEGAVVLINSLLLAGMRSDELAKAAARLQELGPDIERLRSQGNGVTVTLVAEVPNSPDIFAKADVLGIGDPSQVVYFKKMYISEVIPAKRSGATSNVPSMSANLAPGDPEQQDPHELTLTQQIEAHMGEKYPVPGTGPRKGFHFASRELSLPALTTSEKLGG